MTNLNVFYKDISLTAERMA